MIEVYRKTQSEQIEILDAINLFNSDDLYLIENNERIRINGLKILKKLIKSCHHLYLSTDDVDKGFVLVESIIENEVQKNYVKLVANNRDTAKKLIDVLSWNYNKELCVKIRKDSPYIDAFRAKGFRFDCSKGPQLVLKRIAIPLEVFANRTRVAER